MSRLRILLFLVASVWLHNSNANAEEGDGTHESSVESVSSDCLQYTKHKHNNVHNKVTSNDAWLVPSTSAKYINLKYMAREKLLFCLIPKVASSSFIRLLSRIAGVPFKDRKAKKRLQVQDGRNIEALRQGRYQALPSFDSLIASNMSWATRILNSDDWTRVAVFRDPAERLLSAYLDKIQATTAFSRHKLLIYADMMNLTLAVNSSTESIKQALRGISFEEFISKVYHKGLKDEWNPHWRPQSDFCGLQQLAPKLDMVMVLNHSSNTSTSQFIGCLFKSLIDKRKTEPDFHDLKYPSLHQYTRVGGGGFKYTPKVSLTEYYRQIEEELSTSSQQEPRQEDRQNHASEGYVSHAQRHMTKMYSPRLLRKVRHLYQNDYLFLEHFV